MTPSDRWYFAYGSNLNIDRKELRSDRIRKAMRCRLSGYRIAFNKRGKSGEVFANILPSTKSEVWGVIYLCNEEAIEQLDRYEGVTGGHYVHHPVRVLTDSNEEVDALTYVAGTDFVCEEGKPTIDYLNLILSGARNHQLPADYIALLEKLGR